MNSREFYQQFAELKFWKLDADQVAIQLESIIRNEREVKFFADEVGERVRQSLDAKTNIYQIEITDSDLIKYIKSFINFVRAVKGINRDIVRTYINHLLSPAGWINYTNYTDPQLLSIIHQAYRHSDEFVNLYDHFMAFRFYMVEVGDLLVQLPLLKGKSKKVMEDLTKAYGKSNTKKGVDFIQGVIEERNNKQKDIINTHTIPVLDTNNLTSVLEKFGLRTHLDVLTEMAGILNVNNQRYYSKTSNHYHYPPTVSKKQRKLMAAYNECSGARSALIEADAALSIIKSHRPVDPEATWSIFDKDEAENEEADEDKDKVKVKDKDEDVRLAYIKLNDAMLKLNAHLEAIEPLVLDVPALAKIYKRDKRRSKKHIAALKGWNDTPGSASINILKNALSLTDVFKWISDQINNSIKKVEIKDLYQAVSDQYHIKDDLSDHEKNLLLSYNMNARLKKFYPKIEILRTKNFSFGHISIAYQLLYEIGYIVRDYRGLKSPDLIKQIKDRLELDLNLILEELARFYHRGLHYAKQLELEQGLKDDLLIGKLQAIYGLYFELLQLNEDLPSEYKLAIDCNLLRNDVLWQTIEDTTRNIEFKRQEQRYHARTANNALFQFTGILANDTYELTDLIKILAQVKSLPGHQASLYASHLQLIIDKMVGLDLLEDEIHAMEQTVKIIIGDNTENLDEHAVNIKITPHLDGLRSLYQLRAQLRDMLADMTRHKDHPEDLAKITIQHFMMRGRYERAVNYLWSFLYYENPGVYGLEPGVNRLLDLTPLTREIPRFHGIILHELGEVLADHPADPSETETTEDDDLAAGSGFDDENDSYTSEYETDQLSEDELSNEDLEPALSSAVEAKPAATEQDAVAVYTQNNTAMLRHILDSRKGFVILQSEWLRHRFVAKASEYIHEDFREFLGKKYQGNNGIYHIRKKDCIAVVNVKCIHNSMIRIERTLELINYISEIPMDVKLSNWGAIPRISAILSELKIRLNQLFAELAILTKAMTALRDCMKNNTFNVFEQDLLRHLRKMLEMLQQAIDYFYNEKAASDKAKEENIPAKKFLDTAILDVIKFTEWLSPESALEYAPEHQESAEEEPADIAEIEEIDGEELVNEALGGLEIFLKSAGQVDGMYDLSKLEKNSFLYRIAELLNKMRGKVQSNAAHQIDNTAPENAANDTSVVTLIKYKVGDAGLLFKHLATAREILKSMAPAQRANANNQLIIFLKLFVERSGKPARKYRDGAYMIHLMEDGSMQKCVAAFLNTWSDINKFMDSTVSMTEGHHIIGFIKALNNLSDIKFQIDQSRFLGIIEDTLLQYNFDSTQLRHKIHEVISQALTYLRPKIIDMVAQARIAEVTLGLNQDLLLKKLEAVLDGLISLGKKFSNGRFDDIKNGFPFDAKTLEIAEMELKRLGELNLSSDSQQQFLNNAIASLKPFARNLTRKKSSSTALSDSSSVTNLLEQDTLTEVESPLVSENKQDDERSLPLTIAKKPAQSPKNNGIFSVRMAPKIVLAVPRNRKVSDDSDEENAQPKVIALRQACLDYKHHLECEINRLNKKSKGVTFNYRGPTGNYDQPLKADDILALTIDKFNIVLELQQTLKTTASASQQLTNFSNTFTKKYKDKLSEHRDKAATRFLKKLAAICTFGVLYGLDLLFNFGIYQPRGKRLTQQIERLVPPPAIDVLSLGEEFRDLESLTKYKS